MTLLNGADGSRPKAREKSWRRWALYGVAGLCLAGCLLLLPCSVQVLDGEGWVRSAHSLQTIGLALRLYHEKNGRLPPAVVKDKDGRPLYSWRVLLLPYLAEDSLFGDFNPDEAWDGPHNQKLLEKMPRCYVPALESPKAPYVTRYQVFVGPGTAFERDGLTWDDFPDGLTNTLLVVEAGEPVPWSKPADLVYDPERPVPPLGGAFSKPVHFLCYEIGRKPGFNACFADGSIRLVSSKTGVKTMHALISRDGGEPVDLSRLE